MYKTGYSEERVWESLKDSSFSRTQEMLNICLFDKSGQTQKQTEVQMQIELQMQVELKSSTTEQMPVGKKYTKCIIVAGLDTRI